MSFLFFDDIVLGATVIERLTCCGHMDSSAARGMANPSGVDPLRRQCSGSSKGSDVDGVNWRQSLQNSTLADLGTKNLRQRKFEFDVTSIST